MPDETPRNGKRINRRDFVTQAAGMTAAGGGLAFLSPGGASATAPNPGGWGAPWRPASPQRLSSATHELARRALSGEHGRSMANATFAMDDDVVAGLSPDMRYAHATMLCAKNAPLRVLPGERVVGAATLLEAPAHRTPVAGVGSVSHTTIGFHRVLQTGYAGLRRRIEERLTRGGFDDDDPKRGAELLRAMTMCLDAADVWHARYVAELERLAEASAGTERENYFRTRDALRNVPHNPPQTFHEAVESLWFMYAFQRLMGNWSGIGRIDDMLGPHLERDLAEGRTTLDEAREVLAHFWIKGCEWIGAFDTRGSGDAQHYQNIILGGVDAAGRDITNPVTYLVLDIVEELHISDFPIAVRINKNTSTKLLRRIAQVQRHGGGIVAVYNEDVVIDGLVKFGYGLEEARGFTNDGCWETLIPGKTNFIYSPFDGLALLHEVLGLQDTNTPAPEYADFENLYAAYVARLARQIDGHNRAADGFAKDGPPTPLLSMFVDDCIERGRGYYDRGSHYNVLAPHIGGMANVANSLLVIKQLVFEDAYLTLPQFIQILRDDWDGQEHLRRLVLKRFVFYGNDNDDADAMVQRVFNDYTKLVAAVPEREGVLRPAGISTFGREIEWSLENSGRRASPDGHHRGAVLATNFSPSPGTDSTGPTAVLKSYCKMDFTRCPNGATVELKVHPDTVRGEQGVAALVGLMRGFVSLGGMFLHIDVVDSALLLDAQRHPEKYPNLSVRIAGWSARFVTLDKHWQDMVIGRTQQMA